MTYTDLICNVLQKGQVGSSRNRRASKTTCMNCSETMERSVVSAHPLGYV